jgi:tetratricopeptide (TPR) repeat protein
MARTAAAGFWSLGRAGARTLPRGLGAPSSLKAGLILIALMFAGASQAEPVKGEASLSAGGGYARLVFKLAEDVDAEVIAAGSILVVRFKRPVDIPVDQLSDAVPDYVGSVRRDPDGSAIRLSLTRRVTINTMTAGERVFVDLLPDTWSGHPPGLPVEVLRELSERARAAERALRQQRAAAEAQKRAPVRVRASVQPTFVRFVFETPDGVGVSSVLNDQKLTLLFNAALSFDLADAKVAAPSNIASINQKIEGESSMVEVALIGDVDVRSFRDEKNYIIDVAFQQAEKPSALASPAPDASHASAAPDASHAPASAAPASAPPAPVAPVSAGPVSASPAPAAAVSAAPAAPAPAAPAQGATEKPAEAPPQSRQSGEIAPPASENSSRQAKIEIVAVQTLEISKPAPPSKEMPPAAALAPPNPALAAPELPPQAKAPDSAVSVSARRDSDGLHLMFSFAAATPAALFRRADTVWLVFDSLEPLDIDQIRSQGGSLVSEVSALPLERGQAIRIRLSPPQLPSLAGEDQAAGVNWTVTFSDTMLTLTQPLAAIRNITDPVLANVTVPLSRPGLLHRLLDPDAGDALMVVTALPPVRGFIKRQDFVEMSLLESIQGVAVRPNSDDVAANIAPDRIILGKPGGLTLSSAEIGAERAPTAVRPIFDIVEWRKNQAENFVARQDALFAAAAAAEPERRTQVRVDLARFYMSRGLYPEAKGVLDLALADAKPGGLEDPVALTVHSVASSLMGRPEQGLKDLLNPGIGTNYDSQMWKGLAYARQGRWAEAREKFKNAEFAITSLPIELQRIVISEVMRCSLEVKDYSGAAKRSDDLEVVGIPFELKGAISVLRGRLAEALGHDMDALGQYGIAIGSADRAAAAEAKLLEIVLRQKRDEISQSEMLRELETLSAIWRGDAVEVRALQIMARIYPETGRYNESFAAARTATRLQPNSEAARQAQDAAAALFAQLFLSPKGDDLPPVDALGMFYEYRELTPIGRRGDEMIRRLADRLVAVDLLDQASELLQYQVDKRLEGAARAQVAARLAMVYLTSRKPDRAISALRSTRIADLSGELRQQRLLLEARAQSDIGRHDLALDIISHINGREAIRLRSDIYWASRRWREASEQIELYYADRWRDFKPLNPLEKGDVIRAAVGYALAEDAIGLARFREKYAPLMSAEPDRAAFETASQPAIANRTGFADIARMAASVDTLDGFLREMRTRFPDATARAPLAPGPVKADPFPTGSLPEIVGLKRVEAAR